MAEIVSDDGLSLEALGMLSELTFDDPEPAIAALEAGLAAEAKLDGSSAAAARAVLRGKLLLRLGDQYLERRERERADNIEQALASYIRARDALVDKAPFFWAQAQHNLGRAYDVRIRGDRADNVELAIAFCEAALTVRTREAFPTDWAKTVHNLAIAHADRIRGERADNIERAIALYEAALTVRTREAFPVDWAMTQHNLAIAYKDRIHGEQADNIERAIALYQAALEVRTREAFPVDWAWTTNVLAIAYRDRICGERADNIERAIALCDAALTVLTREAFPVDWARTLNGLAIAFLYRIRGEQADNIERAIGLFEAALTVRTRDAFPGDWALTLNYLAVAHRGRIRGERADNIERAIALCEAALTVHTRDNFPVDWARARSNLASAYGHRIHGERAVNIERAIALYVAVLEVSTREADPLEWASTQGNLANVYLDRIRGERADNIERAIALYEAVLEVFTREAYPVDWAKTQHNLALAYADRIRGERADNIERAIALYEPALTVLTREAFPRLDLEASHHLGSALLRQRNWRQAAAILTDGREAFMLLFGQGLDEAESRGLVESAGPLFACAAYAAAEIGENEQAFALACEGRARLLATALRLRRLDLPAAENAHVDELRTSIREQSRLLEQVDGLQRTETLDRLAALRSELAGLVAKSEARSGKDDPMAEAERICADGTVIVAPVVTEVGGKLFIVAPTSEPRHRPRLVVVDVPALTSGRMKTLMRANEGWLSAFASDIAWAERKRRSVRAVEGVGAQLWTLVAEPLEAALEKLGVAPDAPLAFLPSSGFGLLPLGLAKDPSSNRRLIERREIVYAPSLAALDPANAARRHGQEEAGPSLAAVINPTGDLIYASIEGALAASGFTDRVMLDQSNATPAAVFAALKGKDHWHFATHGVFDLEEARRSALAMKDGGKLSVGELLEAEDLGRPRLVVLSACETGLHDVERLPEEFVGFPGAFMTLGAQAVLGTLWPVDDCATTLLTARFYDGHLNEGLAPAAALRQAQLWLASATRDELASYARQKGAQNGLAAPAVRQLEGAIAGAGAELVRFFNVAAVGQHGDGPPAASASEPPERPARPFTHPIYWGAFVLTGR
jgi:CHAT domain-containing protein/tetratricopeptide (TPR) repeat protein